MLFFLKPVLLEKPAKIPDVSGEIPDSWHGNAVARYGGYTRDMDMKMKTRADGTEHNIALCSVLKPLVF